MSKTIKPETAKKQLTMKLYYSPGACSMASHILFNEWDIPNTIESVDLRTHKTEKGEDFYKINPKGYVPVLILDNGHTLTENIAILSYLSDSKGAIKGDRYQFLEWLAFISTELHKGIGSLFGYPDGPQEVVKGIKDKVAKRLKLVDDHLAGKDFMFGDSFSAADAYLVTILNWCPKFKIDLIPYKNINDYFKRMMVRPSIYKTLQQEGLVKGQ
jgi:glutathione S-transferase